MYWKIKLKYYLQVTIVGVLLLLWSCSGDAVYSESLLVPEDGWQINDSLVYTFNIDSPEDSYNIFLEVENTEAYPYNNLWLFVQTKSPDNQEYIDTLQCFLSDEKGNWLGSTFVFSDKYVKRLTYKSGIQFAHGGQHQIKIIQGMRNDKLPGISQLTLELQKAD